MSTGGGFIELLSKGRQDVYLTQDPQMSFWKFVYKQHTNFSIESISQSFIGQVRPNNEVTAVISRNGDLMNKCYIVLDANCYTYSIEDVIESVELEIGGQIIEKHNGKFMDIWNELTLSKSKQKGFQNITKHIPPDFYKIYFENNDTEIYNEFEFQSYNIISHNNSFFYIFNILKNTTPTPRVELYELKSPKVNQYTSPIVKGNDTYNLIVENSYDVFNVNNNYYIWFHKHYNTIHSYELENSFKHNVYTFHGHKNYKLRSSQTLYINSILSNHEYDDDIKEVKSLTIQESFAVLDVNLEMGDTSINKLYIDLKLPNSIYILNQNGGFEDFVIEDTKVTAKEKFIEIYKEHQDFITINTNKNSIVYDFEYNSYIVFKNMYYNGKDNGILNLYKLKDETKHEINFSSNYQLHETQIFFSHYNLNDNSKNSIYYIYDYDHNSFQYASLFNCNFQSVLNSQYRYLNTDDIISYTANPNSIIINSINSLLKIYNENSTYIKFYEISSPNSIVSLSSQLFLVKDIENAYLQDQKNINLFFHWDSNNSYIYIYNSNSYVELLNSNSIHLEFNCKNMYLHNSESLNTSIDHTKVIIQNSEYIIQNSSIAYLILYESNSDSYEKLLPYDFNYYDNNSKVSNNISNMELNSFYILKSHNSLYVNIYGDVNSIHLIELKTNEIYEFNSYIDYYTNEGEYCNYRLLNNSFNIFQNNSIHITTDFQNGFADISILNPIVFKFFSENSEIVIENFDENSMQFYEINSVLNNYPDNARVLVTNNFLLTNINSTLFDDYTLYLHGNSIIINYDSSTEILTNSDYVRITNSYIEILNNNNSIDYQIINGLYAENNLICFLSKNSTYNSNSYMKIWTINSGTLCTNLNTDTLVINSVSQNSSNVKYGYSYRTFQKANNSLVHINSNANKFEVFFQNSIPNVVLNTSENSIFLHIASDIINIDTTFSTIASNDSGDIIEYLQNNTKYTIPFLLNIKDGSNDVSSFNDLTNLNIESDVHVVYQSVLPNIFFINSNYRVDYTYIQENSNNPTLMHYENSVICINRNSINHNYVEFEYINSNSFKILTIQEGIEDYTLLYSNSLLTFDLIQSKNKYIIKSNSSNSFYITFSGNYYQLINSSLYDYNCKLLTNIHYNSNWIINDDIIHDTLIKNSIITHNINGNSNFYNVFNSTKLIHITNSLHNSVEVPWKTGLLNFIENEDGTLTNVKTNSQYYIYNSDENSINIYKKNSNILDWIKSLDPKQYRNIDNNLYTYDTNEDIFQDTDNNWFYFPNKSKNKYYKIVNSNVHISQISPIFINGMLETNLITDKKSFADETETHKIIHLENSKYFLFQNSNKQNCYYEIKNDTNKEINVYNSYFLFINKYENIENIYRNYITDNSIIVSDFSINRNRSKVNYSLIEYISSKETFNYFNTGPPEFKPKRLYIPLNFWFCNDPSLSLPIVALQNHEILFKIKFGNKIKTDSCQLWIDYIYLDNDERKIIAQNDHDILVTQVQYIQSSEDQIYLNFNHPCKELIWKTKYEYETALLILNGKNRMEIQDMKYFQVFQPLHYHTNVPSKEKNISVYSFSLDPENPFQPSGTCNFSRIDNTELRIKSKLKNEVEIWALNWNIFQISGGNGGMMYVN